MRVISPLADLDLEIGTMRREGNLLVVRSAPGVGIDTEVYVHPRDVWKMLKAVVCSRGALAFALFLPFFWWRARRQPDATQSGTTRSGTPPRAGGGPDSSDPNNPWT